MAGALIVTAELGPEESAWLDRLRRQHFPPERNHLAAHLTMFHALPPSAEQEARALLANLARDERPDARIAEVMDLGGGTAFRIESHDLSEIRTRIADHFAGMLTAQDRAGWRPHVTVQNKVSRADAVSLQRDIKEGFGPRPILIRGLELHRYLGGPWELLGRWRFRG